MTTDRIEQLRAASQQFPGVLQVLIAGSRDVADLEQLRRRECGLPGEAGTSLVLVKAVGWQRGEFHVAIYVGTPPVFAERTPELVELAKSRWQALIQGIASDPWEWLATRLMVQPSPRGLEYTEADLQKPWVLGYDPAAPRFLIRSSDLFLLAAELLTREAEAKQRVEKTEEKPPSKDESKLPGSADAFRRALSYYTRGVSDEKLKEVVSILANKRLTVNEKLEKLDDLKMILPQSTAAELGELLGCSKQAVAQSEWWKTHRKGEQEERVARREEALREKGRSWEWDQDES
jgi:hypothetical protein